jgi:NADH-quinone oxidoreductase subunit J
MVLFLFVIMLLGVAENVPVVERIRGQRPLALLLGTGLAVEIIVAVRAGIGFAARAPAGFDAVNRGGNAKALGTVLFNSYFLPFEVTSVLLIVAAVAAVVLAQRRGHAVTLADRAGGAAAAEGPEPTTRPADPGLAAEGKPVA